MTCWGLHVRPNLQSLSGFENLYIAYSGGVDSHVLLHLCATGAQILDKITAVYIDHGLQPEAQSWGRHCERVCQSLSVKFLSLKTNAHPAAGESPEEAARNARYAALKPLLGKDDVLLLAQHREDQLETVLLQLFRGSGLQGLSGMPESMAFGQGKLIRPLLDVSKAEILAYARSHALDWVEDPSNRQSHFDRNLLRNAIIPLLKQRWPALDKTVARSAKHCADAQILLATHAGNLLDHVLDPIDRTLLIDHLLSFSSLEQALIVRQWFRFLGLKIPSQEFVRAILAEVVAAREDAAPVITRKHFSIRRYRNKLYCVNSLQPLIKSGHVWPANELLLKVTEGIIYECIPSDSGIPLERWQNSTVTVKFRSGGETIRLPGRQGSHTLKNLFQDAAVPVWERVVIPLIFFDNRLAAVGERWICSDYFSEDRKPCFRIIRRKINPKANDDWSDVG